MKYYKSPQENEDYYAEHILYYSKERQELALVAYAIRIKPNIIGLRNILNAAKLYDITILKYLIEHGANPNLLQKLDLNKITYTARNYLKSIGI